jgi:hypothetical protein
VRIGLFLASWPWFSPEEPVALARPWLTVYLGGMGAKGKNFYYERAGATSLVAMPFGDRPAIVEQLGAAVAA